MGNVLFRRTQWAPANPYTYNEATAYAPGELGGVLPVDDGLAQKVVIDSGATAATPQGIVAIAQVAFWKDKANYIVTNDNRFANGGVGDARNFRAGVFMAANTAGYYGFICVAGKAIPVKCTSSPTGGETLVANTGTNADSVAVAAGTSPTCKPIGIAVAAKSGSTVATDVDTFDTV